MKRAALLASLLAFAAPRGDAAPRDLDVLVSAGSPLDWLSDLPRPIPSVDRTRLGGEGVRPTMVEEPPHVAATDVFSFARITTVDLIGEIPWTVRREDATTPAIYPPRVGDDVLWLALSVLLRQLLHPAQVNEAETFEYLTYLGEPTFSALEMAATEKSLAPLVERFRAYVNPIPKERPDPPKGADDAETMMLRLTAEDLTCAHPFSFDMRFAGRISLLGDEAVPWVIEASTSSHSFLARNAVVMLGRYEDPKAMERLREILRTSVDSCMRARAVDALVRRRDGHASGLFEEMLGRTRDRSFALSLIRGLGVLNSKASVPTILEWARGRQDFDSACTVLTALARLAPDRHKDEVLKRVQAFAQVRYDDPSPVYNPVSRDPPGTRNAIIEQLGLLVRASVKDEEAQRAVFAQVEGARRDLKDANPADRRLARGIRSVFWPPVVYALLQHLGRSPRGVDLLTQIAADAAEDVVVRVHALIEIARTRPPDLPDRMIPFIALEQDQPVVETALRILQAVDPAMGTAASAALVEQHRRDLPAAKKSVILVALRYLSSRGALTLDRLVELGELELMALEEKAKAAGDAAPETRGRGERRDFASPVPFLEHLAVEIGRRSVKETDAAALGILADILGEPGLPGRAEAAIGLGGGRVPAARPALLKALADDDPWVRLMSHRALKYSLGRDAPCDWLFGTPEARARAVEQFRAWVQEGPK